MTLGGLAVWLSADIDWDGHMDLDGWGGALMIVAMIVFWGLFFLAIAWVAREYGRRLSDKEESSGPVAILDRRLAEGDISLEDYRERRSAIAREGAESAPGDGSA